jgi:DNA-binding CsgD family transcriptional regulator
VLFPRPGPRSLQGITIGSLSGGLIDVQQTNACELCPLAQPFRSHEQDPGILTGLWRLDRLSPRELDVFTLPRNGPSNHEISTCLSISERTVKAHLASIMEKLTVTSRLQVSMLALLHDLKTACREADPAPAVIGRPIRPRTEVYAAVDRRARRQCAL